MKKFVIIFILVLTNTLFGQEINKADSNSLATVKLKYQILDSNTVKLIAFQLTNSKYTNILSYKSKGQVRLAYFTTDKDRWTSIALPFSEETNDFSFINLGSKESSALVVKGMVTKSEKRGRSEHRSHTYVMLIININSAPIQIFKVNYGCDETEIPYDGANKNNYNYNKYERKIEVTDKELILSSPDKKAYSFENCNITEIPDGTYTYDGVKYKRIP